MKKLTKKQKILRWAKENKTRPVGHMLTELNTTKYGLLDMIGQLETQGWINYDCVKKNSIQFSITKYAYYNRKNLFV